MSWAQILGLFSKKRLFSKKPKSITTKLGLVGSAPLICTLVSIFPINRRLNVSVYTLDVASHLCNLIEHQYVHEQIDHFSFVRICLFMYLSMLDKFHFLCGWRHARRALQNKRFRLLLWAQKEPTKAKLDRNKTGLELYPSLALFDIRWDFSWVFKRELCDAECKQICNLSLCKYVYNHIYSKSQ